MTGFTDRLRHSKSTMNVGYKLQKKEFELFWLKKSIREKKFPMHVSNHGYHAHSDPDFVLDCTKETQIWRKESYN